jgi:hypothetical protein
LNEIEAPLKIKHQVILLPRKVGLKYELMTKLKYLLGKSKGVNLNHIKDDLDCSIQFRVLFVFQQDIKDVEDDFSDAVFKSLISSLVFINRLFSLVFL